MSKLRGIKLQYMSFCLAVFVIFSTFFSLDVAASGIYNSSLHGHFDTSSTSSGFDFWTLNFSFDDFDFSDHVNGIESDSYYEVTFNSVLDIQFSESMNIRIPYVVMGDRVLVLGDNASSIKDYTSTSEKTFVFQGDELLQPLPLNLKGYVFKKDGFKTDFDATLNISVVSCSEVVADDSQSYDEGYADGYEEGEQFGYSDGYNNGFTDGENEGFDEGFEAGKDSIDTESIYMEGYEAGREVAYVEGYDEGYAKGYAEALSVGDSNSTSMLAGEVKKYSFTRDYANLGLDMDDFNTTYPSLAFCSNIDTEILYIEGLQFTDGEIRFEDGYIDNDPFVHVYAYNRSPLYSVFETSPDVYAYKVDIKPTKISLTTSDVYNLRLVFGSMTQILNDNAFLGASIADGGSASSSFWYVNDYSQEQLYISYLSRFRFIYPDDYASYDLKFSFDVEVIPYSKQEYNASVSAIEKQTLEIKNQTQQINNQFNDLKNGFDSSAGDSMNSGFSSSLNDYETAEDSLFASARSGLDDFNLFYFTSIPGLVTGISFVTATMNSIFEAMGGETGPVGIVLAFMFSVILVSMAVGLYRFFNHQSKGGDD